jgi:hypothetical protein
LCAGFLFAYSSLCRDAPHEFLLRSVAATVRPTAEITTSYEIIDVPVAHKLQKSAQK